MLPNTSSINDMRGLGSGGHNNKGNGYASNGGGYQPYPISNYNNYSAHALNSVSNFSAII